VAQGQALCHASSQSDNITSVLKLTVLKPTKEPMADPLTPEVSDRICKHMNDDHADAVLLYAKAFASVPDASTARMVSIDPEGMNLQVERDAGPQPIRVTFDHTLQDSEDAHQTLIAMVRQARTNAS